jgi:hypothetical protein
MPLHGQYVCPDCFEYEDICAFVREHLEVDECSYCGKTSEDRASIAANVDTVIDFIQDKLAEEYEDPVEQVGWDDQLPGREGPSRPHLSGTGVAGFVIMRSAYWRLRS